MMTKIKSVKNMQELDILRENLQNQQLIYEKELVHSSVNIIDNFRFKIKDLFFDLGTSLAVRLILALIKRRTKR